MDRQSFPASLYVETAKSGVVAPSLAGHIRTSVAIIGGGYTGLSAALCLAERGVRVVVLEANDVGWGASGRNGGQVNPGLKADPDEIVRRFGNERGNRMIDWAWNGPSRVFELVRQHGMECEARQDGTIRAAYTTTDERRIMQSIAQYVRHGMPVELLSSHAMQSRTGSSRYLVGMLDRRGGSLNPLGYARGLAAAARRAGAEIYGASRVLRVRRDGAHWTLTTVRGSVDAEQVVLGTNGYTDEVAAAVKNSLVPVYSAIIATEPLPDTLATTILPGRQVVYELGPLPTYFRVDEGNRLLIGGRSVLRSKQGLNSFLHLKRYASRLWPFLNGIEWTHGWNGRVAITLDHYPHVHEPAPGMLVGVGYNGRGVAMATLVGELLARRALGAKDDELELPISPIAPVPLRRFWRVGVAARIAYGRMRTRLSG